MAIKEFDRPTARVVSEQAQRALEETARLYGLTVTYRGGRFTTDTFTAKFEFAVQNPDGTAKSSDVEAFERYAPQRLRLLRPGRALRVRARLRSSHRRRGDLPQARRDGVRSGQSAEPRSQADVRLDGRVLLEGMMEPIKDREEYETTRCPDCGGKRDAAGFFVHSQVLHERADAERAIRAAVARARYEASCAAEQVGYQCPPGSPERKACFDVAREIIQGGKQ